jgi:hypothetical protein
MEENRIPKRILYMNLESTGPRGRPRNRRQDEVREDGRIVDGEVWQEKLYNREEWKNLLEVTGPVKACNEIALHVSSVTCSTSGDLAQMTLGMLRACYVGWLLPGLEWSSAPLQPW